MSNTLSKLPRSVAVLLLVLQLALAPLPASAWNYHWEGWHVTSECEWYGYHRYDETGSGYVYGRTNGRNSCAEVFVRVYYDGISVKNYGGDRAEAAAYLWEPDFERSRHSANPIGPASWAGFVLS